MSSRAIESLSGSLEGRYAEALDALVDELKHDRSILAGILCGSLSHDTVWAKSDIDLLLITIDDKKAPSASVSLNASGLNVHACLMSRTDFRQLAQGSLHNSFIHSYIAKGRVLYAHDDSITELWQQLREVGERDTRIQLLSAGIHALGPVDKAHKWFVTRGDLNYSALWILYAASALARIEILNKQRLAGREVLPQAMELNPEFFKVVYTDLLNTKKTTRNVSAALEAIDEYLAARSERLFGLVLEHLKDARETRSATDLEDHFKRNFGVEGVTMACEYLSDRKLIGKVATPIQLTKRSNVSLQELAFVYMEEPEDAY